MKRNTEECQAVPLRHYVVGLVIKVRLCFVPVDDDVGSQSTQNQSYIKKVTGEYQCIKVLYIKVFCWHIRIFSYMYRNQLAAW